MQRPVHAPIVAFAMMLLSLAGCPQGTTDGGNTDGTPGPQGPAGPQGPPGPVDSTAPPKPTQLRVFKNFGLTTAGAPASGPPAYQLRWNFPDSTVAIDSFNVYESGSLITAADQKLITAIASGAARSATIQLFVDSGTRHFRVAAVSYTGVEGPLSDEYVVDTTSRILINGVLRTASIGEFYSAIPGSGADPIPISGALAPDRTMTNYNASPDGRHVALAIRTISNNQIEWLVAPQDGSSNPVSVSGSVVAGGHISRDLSSWSPDGTRFAFLADKVTPGVVELFVAPADGSAEPVKVSGNLVSNGDVTTKGPSLVWSQDGTHVAFIADKLTDEVFELFVASADGSGEPIRVSGAAFAAGGVESYRWSPDGTRLLFSARESPSAPWQVYSAPADGSAVPTRVSGDLKARQFSFDWSPDASRVAFLASRNAGDILELFVSPADGSEPPIAISGSMPADADVAFFIWSPDGSRIAFVANKNAPDKLELYANFPTSGVDPVLLSGAIIAGGTTQNMGWSPDSSSLAFLASKLVADKFELFLARPDEAGEPVKISGTLPATADVTRYSWSPDGSRLVMVADRDTDEVLEAYVLPSAPGPEPKKVSGTIVANGDVEGALWSSMSN